MNRKGMFGKYKMYDYLEYIHCYSDENSDFIHTSNTSNEFQIIFIGQLRKVITIIIWLLFCHH